MNHGKQYDFGDLKGKVAVLTGGTGVIGGALARALGTAGVKVALAGRDEAKASAVAQAIADETGGTLVGVGLDVLDLGSLEAARARVNALWGPIDLLINGAGGNRPSAVTAVEQMAPGPVADWDATFFGIRPEGLDEVVDLNFTGTVLPSQVFARDMVNRGGVILNISSMAAFSPLTKVLGYSASKAAVDNFTRWLAVHLAPQNIRVNALAPGFFLTEQNRFLMVDAVTGEPTARAKKVIAGTPMGRFGAVEELEGAALFLLSDLARFVTGAVLAVDGGFSAYGKV